MKRNNKCITGAVEGKTYTEKKWLLENKHIKKKI